MRNCSAWVLSARVLLLLAAIVRRERRADRDSYRYCTAFCMCGRSRQALQAGAVAHLAARDAGIVHTDWAHRSRYVPTENLCPGRTAAVVAMDANGARVATLQWGLIPRYDKSEKPDHWKMFNARSETIATSPVFSRLYPRQRCVVPLDGFFGETTACRSPRIA